MAGKTKRSYRAPRLEYLSAPEQQAVRTIDCPADPIDLVAVEAAYEQCLSHYRKNLQHRYRVYLGLGTTTSNHVCRGMGSMLNLFPQTKFGDFRTWAPSADDAWSQDWYSVGADLYESLFKCLRMDSSNAGTAKTESLERPSWGRSVEGTTT